MGKPPTPKQNDSSLTEDPSDSLSHESSSSTEHKNSAGTSGDARTSAAALTEKRREKRHNKAKTLLQKAVQQGFRPPEDYLDHNKGFKAYNLLNALLEETALGPSQVHTVQYSKQISLPVKLRELLAKTMLHKEYLGRRLSNLRRSIDYIAGDQLPRLTGGMAEKLEACRRFKPREKEDIAGDTGTNQNIHKNLDPDGEAAAPAPHSADEDAADPKQHALYPRCIIIVGGAYRACDIAAVLKDIRGVVTMFAKHHDLDAVVSQIASNHFVYRHCNIAVGTPSRIAQLIARDAVRLNRLKSVVFDSGYIDLKNRSTFEYADVRCDAVSLYKAAFCDLDDIHYYIL